MHNLVKSFLTLIKFTFDNLSRKIKNPCLVINKNLFQKENFKMKNSKNTKIFTLLIAVALILALSISCKSNEEPTTPVEIPSQYYGTWKYSTGKNALNLDKSSSHYSIDFYNTNGEYLDGASTSFSGGDIGWGFVDVTKNSDTSWSWKGYTFSFNSSTAGTLEYDGKSYTINKQ